MFNAVRAIVRSALVVFASAVFFTTQANAMRVSPMVLEMEAVGSATVARVEVQNINSGRLAFETRVFLMDIDEDGVITEIPADDQFLIFPPQGSVPPGARQVIRLQWVGDPDIETSRAFYVSVEQLPVAFEPGSPEEIAAQVQVLYNLRALVVVAPKDATPDVKAASVRAAAIEVPQPPGSQEPVQRVSGVEIVLRNDGQRHAMMANFGWKLQGTDPEGNFLRVDVSPEELSNAVGTGYVPALGQRRFTLPVGGFGDGPIELTFQR